MRSGAAGLAPVLESVAQKYEQNATVLKLNVDDYPSASSRFNVKGIPTLILFKEGKEAGRLVGLQQQEEVGAFIENAGGVLRT